MAARVETSDEIRDINVPEQLFSAADSILCREFAVSAAGRFPTVRRLDSGVVIIQNWFRESRGRQ